MEKSLLDRTKEQLNDISDILYKGNVTEGIANMQEVIPALAEIASGMEDTGLQEKMLQDVLTPALGAMEEKDGTLLADIISYELMDLLGELS